MRRYFGSTDWRVNMTVFLIILFFTAPLFLVAYRLGVYVRDHYYLPRSAERAPKKEMDRAGRKREFGEQWGSEFARRSRCALIKNQIFKFRENWPGAESDSGDGGQKKARFCLLDRIVGIG
jgi:hypothetical protein